MKYPPLTHEQEQAIIQYVNRNGPRMWKTAVRQLWQKGVTTNKLEVTLYGLRNSHGPTWLKNYRVPVDL